MLAIYTAVPVALFVVIVIVLALIYCILRRHNQGDPSNVCSNSLLIRITCTKLIYSSVSHYHSGPTNNSVKPQNETPMSHLPNVDAASAHSSLQLQNRRFTYKELETITNNFQRVLGRGGFGYVYYGLLVDGTQVAVKLRSDSSNQGVKEFLAEVGFLHM